MFTDLKMYWPSGLIVVQELIESLTEKLNEQAGVRRYLLGITGYPGAGKSTLAESTVELVNHALSQAMAVVVPMDGFHLSDQTLRQHGLWELKGIPDSFDAEGFVRMLHELRLTPPGTVRCPRFDRSIEASIPEAIVVQPGHRLVVVEGNYLLLESAPWNQVRPLLDEVWFMDGKMEEVYPRPLDRHICGGRTPEQARAKVESTDLPNARLIEQTRSRADRIVSVTPERVRSCRSAEM